MDLLQVAVLILTLIGFPFYVFIVCKWAGAGWVSGVDSYLTCSRKRKSRVIFPGNLKQSYDKED